MMIIVGVRMAMAMGDKSGSNESGRWRCDSSWVLVVALVSVVVLVRVVVVVLVVVVAVVKVMSPCFSWRRGYCSPHLLVVAAREPQPPAAPRGEGTPALASFVRTLSTCI